MVMSADEIQPDALSLESVIHKFGMTAPIKYIDR
jgi:hypothetical protein